MKLNKLMCVVVSALLIGTMGNTIFATTHFIDAEATVEPIGIEKMSMVTEQYPFEFEVVTYDSSEIVVKFTSLSRINDYPYIGIKGTKTPAEKISASEYVLEYNGEYSVAYNCTEAGNQVIYNATIIVGDDVSDEIEVVNVVKNIVPSVQNRASGTLYEQEPNNTKATAKWTEDDYDNYGAISSSTDTADWWKVVFAQDGQANFWLGNVPEGCDFDLYLYDETYTTDSNYLMRSQNGSNAQELIQYNVTAGVEYYIKVSRFSGSSTDSYLFRAKNYPTNTTDRVLTFVLYNDATKAKYNGAATISIRGYYHNADHTTRSITNIAGSTAGYNIGYNIRANGYHTYVSPTNDIDVRNSQVIKVYLKPVGTECSDANFDKPLSYCNVTSNFGWRSWQGSNSTYYNNFNKHNGLDFSGTNGVTDIYSICDIDTDDEVVIDYHYSKGNYVQVTDSETLKTITYMHMYELSNISAPVSKGTVVGKVGNTGTSTGPHLHVEIFDNITALYHDPLLYFDMPYNT